MPASREGFRLNPQPRSFMQPVEARFRFRFENGPREKEWIPLAEGLCSIGRLPKNTVQIADASVSGKHAELHVTAEGVTLSDLGSTNGTSVEGERIETLLLGHGDQIQFGKVRASFHDTQVGGEPAGEGSSSVTSGAPSAPRALGAMQSSAGDDTIALEEPDSKPIERPEGAGSLAPSAAAPMSSRISEEVLARSGSGSKLGLVLMLVLILGGGGFAAWMYFRPGPDADGVQLAELKALPGNLLEDYSFEADGLWDAAESAPQAFYVDRSFALSGRYGLGVLLKGDEWALAASAPLRVSGGMSLRLAGSSSASQTALARLGIELIQSEPGAPSVLAWASPQTGADFTESELVFRVPAGIQSARVLLAAKGRAGEAEVAFDDVSLVPHEGSVGEPLRYEEYELSVLGQGGSTAILSRSGNLLFTGISTTNWGFEGLHDSGGSGWEPKAMESGFELRLAHPAAAGTRCELRANGPGPLSAGSDASPYIASMGEGGYRSHALGFKRENASHLLAGTGTNLMRFSTGQLSTLSALNREGQPILIVQLAGAEGLEIQLGFDRERVRAEALALRARSAAADQQSGACLAAWTELLNEVPIDAQLIAEAEAASARILSEGHARIEELEGDLEAADFFQLRDGYRRCRADAERLAQAYGGSEIESKAGALLARIDTALEALDTGGKVGASARLGGVLSAIDPVTEPQLAARLKSALGEPKQDEEDPRK